MYKRYLKIALPKKQSAFLWGARKTGKSTFLKTSFPQSLYYDLLKTDTFQRLLSSPHLLREEILAIPTINQNAPIIIDEIQKIPALLDEVHWLIENTPFNFILCGSSARKLKRVGVNLLGGRAWSYHFFPFVYPELQKVDLLKALNQGLIPSHYLADYPQRSLTAYVHDYLQQEILQEGLVRNLPAFARFLESIPYTLGQMVNFSNIARDCGIDSKTVKEYYQILIDTLLGYYIFPFHKKKKRNEIQDTPKFYLFDVGIANHLAKQKIVQLKGTDAGNAFEQYILMELMAFNQFNEINSPIQYWRTTTGKEVDFILDGGRIAIECKISVNLDLKDLKGLRDFVDEYEPEHALVISQVPRARKVTLETGKSILILPWQDFLEKLWAKTWI